MKVRQCDICKKIIPDENTRYSVIVREWRHCNMNIEPQIEEYYDVCVDCYKKHIEKNLKKEDSHDILTEVG